MELSQENLPTCPNALQKIIVQLQYELSTYKIKYAQLIEEIRLAKQQRFAPSSEKNLLQPDLFDEAGLALTEEVEAQLADSLTVKEHTRQKHPVRRPLPAYLPREVILHDLPDIQKICGCGEPLVRIGEEITEQLKYIPAKLSVVQHVRPKYACKPCQGTVKITDMPLLLLPKSVATPELVAHTIVSKYVDHLPLYRQESIWQRLEIDLPRSSLCGWLMKTAQLCVPLVEQLRENIITSNYVQADETTLQVLAEVGRANTTSSYMWVYREGNTSHPSIVFDYQPTRGGYHAQAFLKGFKGFLQTDAYSGYHWATQSDDIVSVGCMAHARRPFAELVKLTRTPGLAHEALKMLQSLYHIEAEARKNDLSFADRYRLRHNKAPPILATLKKWLDHHLTKVSEQGKLGKAIRYALANWTALTNYLQAGFLEIDNNRLENVIRPFAVGRKNWLFSGSPDGAKAGAILYSLIETCKANQVDPYQYFCAMLHRIRHCRMAKDYRQLLPQFIQL